MNKTTFAFSVVTALALGVVGCGDSSSNGGTGGTPTNMAMVRGVEHGADERDNRAGDLERAVEIDKQ